MGNNDVTNEVTAIRMRASFAAGLLTLPPVAK
jgi:hypothetical protein